MVTFNDNIIIFMILFNENIPNNNINNIMIFFIIK